jgi:hypothetical protein
MFLKNEIRGGGAGKHANLWMLNVGMWGQAGKRIINRHFSRKQEEAFGAVGLKTIKKYAESRYVEFPLHHN